MRILIAMFLLSPFIAAISPGTVDVSLHWTRPVDGAPVAYYEVWLQRNQDEWAMATTTADTTCNVAVDPGVWYFAKVRGVGESGARGAFSEVSNPYSYGISGVPETPLSPIYVPIKKGC